MKEQGHLSVLEWELEAARQVLVSQNFIRNAHLGYASQALQAQDQEKYVLFSSTVREYEQKHIPRTERMIAALEWAIGRLSS
jgi:hypothetical protein